MSARAQIEKTQLKAGARRTPARACARMKTEMKKIILIFIFFIAGCSTNVTPQPTSMSKADGTVTFTYEYGIFEKPVVQWGAAQTKAVKICKGWNYSGAQMVNEALNQGCVTWTDTGCARWEVEILYQCTDLKDEDYENTDFPE